ncbi:MAG: type II toxin-antitoxin system RelE/ParE family toxin [Flavobacteriales bacterium]|nr:type II toxin-antitoxin system RelE/ParE family toxin [Flavobacteriales bacterium]
MKIHKNCCEFTFSRKGRQQFQKLDPVIKKRTKKAIDGFKNGDLDPLQDAKLLSGQLYPLRSYRIGTYRLIFEVRREELVLMAVAIAHRKEVYKKIS